MAHVMQMGMLAKLKAFMERLDEEGWPQDPGIDDALRKNLAEFGEVSQLSGGSHPLAGVLAGVKDLVADAGGPADLTELLQGARELCTASGGSKALSLIHI